MIPTPAHHLPSSSLHTWLHEGFPMTTWQKKRKLRSALQMVLHCIQVPPESGQLNPYAPFLGHLWRTLVKGIPIRGITPSGTPLCSFSLEKYMNKHVSIYWFMDFDQWFCWMVTDFETTWLDDKDLWKKGVWIDVSELVKKKSMNMFMFSVNVHQRMTLAEEDFNNQVDGMTRFVDPI